MLKLAAVSAVVAVGLTLAGPAGAMRRYGVVKRPGKATIGLVLGWASPNDGNNVLRVAPSYIYRSPNNPRATQTICATHQLYQFTGSIYEKAWRHAATGGPYCVDTAPGYQANFAAWDFAAAPYKSYNSELWVTWRARGRLIGAAHYDYDSTSDYRCMTGFCYTDYGYKDVAFLAFTF